MQLTQIADRHGAVAAQSVPDANRRLGEVQVRYLDRDDHVTFTTHHEFFSGGRAGAREGYATLVEAVRDLGRITRGDIGAVAVLEREGRFFGLQLKGRDLEDGLRGPIRRIHLEADDRESVVELRADSRFDRLRAFVDGAWTHRFRG
jgi:hypothetical protein